MDEGATEERMNESKTVDCPNVGLVDAVSCETCKERSGCPALE
jgi:hypothetical protein